MEPARFLAHYLRKEVQEGMVAGAKNRETAVRYGEHGFGKRPDMLSFPQDVAEFAKKGATSFHVSEERWANPLLLETNMRPHEIDALRTGWDLVLDIDAANWAISKITAWLMVKALEEHGIRSISVKFSGNKGWHIGVPFEAFPTMIDRGGKMVETRLLFPEAPRLIAAYLLEYIARKHVRITNNRIFLGSRFSADFEKLKQKLQKEDLVKTRCAHCSAEKKENEKPCVEYGCESCGEIQVKENEEPTTCENCGKLMRLIGVERGCKGCGSEEFVKRVNVAALIEVDTVLISSRHLYRAPYSLHEKSGLVSIPVRLHEILDFDKQRALLDNVAASSQVFPDRTMVTPGEGTGLFARAFDFYRAQQRMNEKREEPAQREKEFEKFQNAAPESFFPLCITQMLGGMKDGKKRAMFVLINFLASVGWNADAIEKRLGEWNQKNAEAGEPLRETVLRGRLRYHRQQKRIVLPPNCDNAAYYASMGVKCSGEICAKCTNPVQYVRRMVWKAQHAGKGKEKKKRVLTEEQKQKMQDARRKYKEFREQMREQQEQKR